MRDTVSEPRTQPSRRWPTSASSVAGLVAVVVVDAETVRVEQQQRDAAPRRRARISAWQPVLEQAIRQAGQRILVRAVSRSRARRSVMVTTITPLGASFGSIALTPAQPAVAVTALDLHAADQIPAPAGRISLKVSRGLARARIEIG
jgi:hypothetical protein